MASPPRAISLKWCRPGTWLPKYPALDGVLQITLAQSDAEQVQADLINAIGQLVSTVQFVNDGNIMRLRLPSSGVYHLVMRLGNGAVITRKVVML